MNRRGFIRAALALLAAPRAALARAASVVPALAAAKVSVNHLAFIPRTFYVHPDTYAATMRMLGRDCAADRVETIERAALEFDAANFFDVDRPS